MSCQDHNCGCGCDKEPGEMMDSVDIAQQNAIDQLKKQEAENACVDFNQQNQIDSLQKSSRFMFAMLLLTALASIAQIVEAIYMVIVGQE